MLEREFLNFATVLAVTVCTTGLIAVLYALGLRMGEAKKGASSKGGAMAARIVSGACFAACALIVLFALRLIIF